MYAHGAAQEPWTWFYHKVLTEQELVEHKEKQSLVFLKDDVPLFSQLMFSWNAFRDGPGYFSFWVQARNATTKNWGPWHKMAEWGNGIQRSFIDKDSPGPTQYIHVRLEAKSGIVLDAFRIKIMGQNGIDLTQLKGFSVSISNQNAFVAEHVDDLVLPSLHIQGVPKISQFMLDHPHNNTICSPTSCSMLTGFLLHKDVDYCLILPTNHLMKD